MALRFPIGIDDFARLRRGGYVYTDRSLLVQEVLQTDADVLLLPRPRRFGKSLGISLLRCFFERPGAEEVGRELFDGLALQRCGADVWDHFGRYPVVHLSLKNVKAGSFEECRQRLALVVNAEVLRHRALIEGLSLAPSERTYLDALLSGDSSHIALGASLELLTRWLHVATGERAVVLLDEYDTPLHGSYAHGFYDEAVTFFRSWFTGGLKGNEHLERAVITGILRVARESLFSDLNNLVVHTVLSPYFASSFGFTETEVAKLAAEAGQSERLPELRRWYDGYHFGGSAEPLYNPWSVLNALAFPAQGCQPYWTVTGSADLLHDLVADAPASFAQDLERLLSGETLERPVADNLALRQLRDIPDAIWSFLLYSGYLTPAGPGRRDAGGEGRWPLAIPNLEVGLAFRSLVTTYLTRSTGDRRQVDRLVHAILQGDDETFEEVLSTVLRRNLSFHDVAEHPGRTPEQVYHVFVVGLLTWLEPDYEVRSNPESGHGRVDVMIVPRKPGWPGAVFELKVKRRRESVQQSLDAAAQQLVERRYSDDLARRGARPIHAYACVFDGKSATVRRLEGV